MFNPKDFEEGEWQKITTQAEDFEKNPDNLKTVVAEFFTTYDEDKSGFLDRKELRHFMEAFFKQFHVRLPLTDDFVFSVFQQIDANHDNKIEPSELQAFAQAFFGRILAELRAAQQ